MYSIILETNHQIILHNQEDKDLVILEAVGRCEQAMLPGVLMLDGDVLGMVMETASYETYMGFKPKEMAS